MAHRPRVGGIEFRVLCSDLGGCIIMRESQGRCDMDKNVEEYRALRDEIVGLLHKINGKLTYQKGELAHQWWYTIGLSFIAIGIGAVGISLALPTDLAAGRNCCFWSGFFLFVTGAIFFLGISGYDIYLACKRFFTKKKKPHRSNC